MPSTAVAKNPFRTFQSTVRRDTIMDFTTLSSLSSEALTEALALDFAALTNDDLDAALTERKAECKRLFALTEHTVADADVAEALVVSINAIEAAQADRAAVVKAASDKFAAARAAFSEGGDDEDEDEADEDEADEDEAEPDTVAEADDAEADDGDAEADNADGAEAVAAAVDQGRTQQVKTSARKAVGKGTKRPPVKSARPVTMTAAADVEGFAMNSTLDGMEQVAEALLSRAGGFSPWNEQAAMAAHQASGGKEQIRKFGVANLNMNIPDALVASGTPGQQYATAREAIKDHQKAMVALMEKGQTLTASALTAAGWCAPSPTAYNYIADYNVSGLLSLPEVPAPRGGLFLTTGPERSSQGTALDDFGWTQTEQQAIDRTAKTFETIDCPDFTDYRLDAVGYGYTIPILTEAAWPELVADTLKFASVLYAHRTNKRLITDILALSDTVTFSGYGPSLTDSLEALELAAMAERRKWNLADTATMEVKVPAFVKAIYRADVSRRNGIAKESVTDNDIARHFGDRHLAVEYLSDFEEFSIDSGHIIVPGGAFTVIIYPSGTFIKAFKPVIKLSATYDAASLTHNEYLGVFFEEALKVIKAGYRSSKISFQVNTAGEQGALTLNGLGDALAGGSV